MTTSPALRSKVGAGPGEMGVRSPDHDAQGWTKGPQPEAELSSLSRYFVSIDLPSAVPGPGHRADGEETPWLVDRVKEVHRSHGQVMICNQGTRTVGGGAS